MVRNTPKSQRTRTRSISEAALHFGVSICDVVNLWDTKPDTLLKWLGTSTLLPYFYSTSQNQPEDSIKDSFSKCIMPRSKEIPEDVKEKIIFYHKSGKGYKAISKIMGVHRSTVRTIISKWKTLGTVMNLPRSGRPTKISPRTQRKIIQEVTKKPEITSKELQASLALAKIKVHDSTIRRRLGQIRKRERVSKRKTLQKKKINACLV
uniref:Uncharacterized protein n=1 Tax=Sinocyclocheilus grahami TaxID=75366 RepID=A0A672NXR3_SINGR